MSGGKKVTIGYKYLLGVHMALAHGPLDKIKAIQVDRRVAWEGDTETDGLSIAVDAPELFGGDEREGGVAGNVTIAMGDPGQTQNAYLLGQLGPDVPAFRGVACAILEKCYMGNNPYLKPWAFLASRTQTRSNGELQWYAEKATITTKSFVSGNQGSVAPLSGNFTFAQYPPEFSSVFPGQGGLIPTVVPEDGQWDILRTAPVELTDGPFSGFDDSRAFVMDGGGTSDPWILTDDDITVPQLTGTIMFRSSIRSSEFAGFTADKTSYYSNNAMGGEFNNNTSLIGTTVGMDVYLEDEPGSDWTRVRFAFGKFGVPDSEYFDYEPRASVDDCSAWKVATFNVSLGTPYFEENGEGLTVLKSIFNASVSMKHYVNDEERLDQHSVSVPIVIDDNGGFGLGPIEDQVLGDWVTTPSESNYKTRYQRRRVVIAHLSNAGSSLSGIAHPCGSIGPCEDMNPAHIIREALTDKSWGMGHDETDVDNTEFTKAADKLFQEKMGISILWSMEMELEDFIKEILRHIDGVLYVSRETGKFVLKLIRDDYDVNSLPVFDETNIAAINDVSRPTVDELTSSVTVQYWDCLTTEQASVTQHNSALKQIQIGNGQSTTIQYPGFTNREIAARAAARDLRTLSSPLLGCELDLNRDAEILNYGDPFILNRPDIGIHSLVMRVSSMSLGDGASNTIKVEVMEDVFSLPDAEAVTSEPGDSWTDPLDTIPLSADPRLVMEAPYYENVQALGEIAVNDLLTSEPDAGFLLAAAGRQGKEINARMHVDSGAGYEQDKTLDFAPSGTTVTEIWYTDTKIYLDGFTDIDEVEPGTEAMIGIDPATREIVRVDSAGTDFAGNYMVVGRGVLDTTPVHHEPNGTPLPVVFFGSSSQTDGVQYVASDSLDVKLQTVAGYNLLPIASTPVDSFTFDSRAIRPYPPGDLRIGGASYPRGHVYSGLEILTWAHRDRLLQTGGTLEDYTAADIGPEVGTTYRVVIEGFDASEVSTGIIVDYDNGGATTLDLGTLSPVDKGDLPVEAVRAVLSVYSVRDSYQSWRPAQFEMLTANTETTDAWTPAEITTELWLSGDVNVDTIAGNVATWRDRSGNGYDFTGPIGQRPELVTAGLNGRDIISFTADEYAEASATALNMLQSKSSVSVFILYKLTDTTGDQRIFQASRNGSARFTLRVDGGKFKASHQREE